MTEMFSALHPLFVFLTIMLCSLGVVLYFFNKVLNNNSTKAITLKAAYWHLWIGGLFTIATHLSGWAARNTLILKESSDERITQHIEIAYVFTGLFFSLILWTIFLRKKHKSATTLFLLVSFLTQAALAFLLYHSSTVLRG